MADIAKSLHERGISSSKLMVEIHAIIDDLMLAIARCAEPTKTSASYLASPPLKIVIPTHLEYGDRRLGRVLRFKPIPLGPRPFQPYTRQLRLIHDYLAYPRWVLVEVRTSGITWLELLAGYEVTGH